MPPQSSLYPTLMLSVELRGTDVEPMASDSLCILLMCWGGGSGENHCQQWACFRLPGKQPGRAADELGGSAERPILRP